MWIFNLQLDDKTGWNGFMSIFLKSVSQGQIPDVKDFKTSSNLTKFNKVFVASLPIFKTAIFQLR
jgi:hypothetical protein